MSSKVKICGLRRLRDIEMANLYEPDYVGFVFAASSRQVTEEHAESLKAELADGILAAGVFVNAPAVQAARIAEKGIIDMI
ncbi:phosphoribosylanthranilate isomerase, partial [Blautia pseudococcoides]|nr:phosphoribosylanthranilate isomerase [Blautia pseudococcoides]